MTDTRNLRLWPGVLLVTIQWLARYVLPTVMPEATAIGVMTGLACGPLVLIWWLFFSRAERAERWGGAILVIVLMALTPLILHESIAGGMMGMMFIIFAIPVVSLALVVWAVLSRGFEPGARRITMVAAIALACGSMALVRTDGINGSAESDFAWRWSETAESRLLAEDAVPTGTAELGSAAPWPGFRGPGRDGALPGVTIKTDWSQTPPEELWRRAVGPGWSSFAAQGEVFFTQEQRGDEEVVSCYRLDTGEPVWQHRYSARFWESNAGAGPRGTPAVSGGRVFAFGATGILSALDAKTGAPIWSRDLSAELDIKAPGWGFSGSPLVLGGTGSDDTGLDGTGLGTEAATGPETVVVAVAGTLAAFDAATGAPRWTGTKDTTGYSSPQLMTLDGMPQVLLVGGDGLRSVDPANGQELWFHEWSGYPSVMAAPAGDDLLFAVTDRSGLRRLAVSQDGGSWTTAERWTSIRLKPYFNGFVVHEGHAYGFDGGILAAIDIEKGERQWKGGRYGHGQLILLPDQDLLVVLTEQGEIALVDAKPDAFNEVALVEAIEGKTWNHPALVGDTLLVRNAEEMAAFRLPVSGS